ncbi:MAG: endonuclease [Deltaproteobacteria bacterium]|nr:MAG: endonuclease [Deltaproteobacteria bacterium]
MEMALRDAALPGRRRRRARQAVPRNESPHLALLRAPRRPAPSIPLVGEIRVATYNVHRWTGLNGRSRPDPARAGYVISELDADLISLQEVLRPDRGDDPLEALAEALGLHVIFAATRVHKRGEIGNAILSRWPIASVTMLDLSYNTIEKRVAIAAQIQSDGAELDVVATHLALADRTRHRQVRSLLDHPRLSQTPTLLMGDMNAWRQCQATRELDQALHEHHNHEWPATFPAASPVLALDRIYARGLHMIAIEAHDSRAARRASDHLPVVARVKLAGRDAIAAEIS